MLKLLMKILIIILIVSFPSTSFAQSPPQMTTLSKDQKAPWTGTLFNPEAIVKMITENEAALEQCNNNGQEKLDKEKAKCDFLQERAKIVAELQKQQFDSILKIKDKEIDNLHDIIKKSNSNNHVWWFAGGTAIGVVTSIAIFYAAVEITSEN